MNLKASFQEHLDRAMGQLEQSAEKHGFDFAVIYSGHAMGYYQDDQYAPFIENPLFRFFCHAAGPGHFIILKPNEKPKLYFKKATGFWHLPSTFGDSFWEDSFDILPFSQLGEVRDQLPKRAGVLSGMKNSQLTECFAELGDPTGFIQDFDRLRCQKTDFEISLLKEANKIAAAGHRVAEARFLEESSELDIHLAYLAACKVTEQELPYSTIVGLNQNAAVLHYARKDSRTSGSTMLIDAGVRFQGYCSDISRTYLSRAGLGTNPPTEAALSVFKYLLEGMEKLQLDICEEIKPGKSYIDLHAMCLEKVCQLAYEVGLIKPELSLDEAIEKQLGAIFLPHGLGHFLGIQVHDVGGKLGCTSPYPFLRNCRDIEVDQVFTIEPGFYLIEQLLNDDNKKFIDTALFKKLMPCGGIRIEDNIRVTETGHENMTRQFL